MFKEVAHYCLFFILLAHFFSAGCGGRNNYGGSKDDLCQDTLNNGAEVSKVKLFFSGDFMAHMPQITHSRREDGTYGFDYYFKYLSQYYNDADFAIINFESTVTPRPPYTGYPRFRTPVAAMEAIARSGADVLLFANNHICDNGDKGISNNIRYADSLNLLRTGAFLDSADFRAHNPLILEKGNIKIGILNYTYATNGLPVPGKRILNLIDTISIKDDIVRTKNMGVNSLIIVYHWGEEYWQKPTLYQKRICEWSIRNGANLIVGSHPHVVQPIVYGCDSVDESPLVVYSLGNFVSNQQETYCKGGISFSIELEKAENKALKYKNGSYLITWVNQKDGGKERKYTVVPSFVADTLFVDDGINSDYYKFVKNTRKLLGESPAKEIGAPL